MPCCGSGSTQRRSLFFGQRHEPRHPVRPVLSKSRPDRQRPGVLAPPPCETPVNLPHAVWNIGRLSGHRHSLASVERKIDVSNFCQVEPLRLAQSTTSTKESAPFFAEVIEDFTSFKSHLLS